MLDNLTGQLHEAISAVCPIYGISIGRWDDKSTWRITFADESTVAQFAAAQQVVENFDVVAARNTNVTQRGRESAMQDKLRQLAEAMVDDPGLLGRLRAQR